MSHLGLPARAVASLSKNARNANVVRAVIPLALERGLEAHPRLAPLLAQRSWRELLAGLGLGGDADKLASRVPASAVDPLPVVYEGMVQRLIRPGGPWRRRALHGDPLRPETPEGRSLETLREALLPELVDGLFGRRGASECGAVLTWLDLDPGALRERFGDMAALTQPRRVERGEGPLGLVVVEGLQLLLASTGIALVMLDLHVVQSLRAGQGEDVDDGLLAVVDAIQYLPLLARRPLAPTFLDVGSCVPALLAAGGAAARPAMTAVVAALSANVADAVRNRLGADWGGEAFDQAFKATWGRAVRGRLEAALGGEDPRSGVAGLLNGTAPDESAPLTRALRGIASHVLELATPPKGTDRAAGDAGELWLALWPQVAEALAASLTDLAALAAGFASRAPDVPSWGYVEVLRFVLGELGLDGLVSPSAEDLRAIDSLFIGSDRGFVFSHVRLEGDASLDDEGTIDLAHRLARRHGKSYESLVAAANRPTFQAFPTIRYHLALEGASVFEAQSRNREFPIDIVRVRHFALFALTQVYRASLLQMLTRIMREPRDAAEPSVAETVARLEEQASHFARLVHHRHASPFTHLQDLFDRMLETARIESLWQSVQEDLDLLSHARARVEAAATHRRRRFVDVAVSAVAGAAALGTVAGLAGAVAPLLSVGGAATETVDQTAWFWGLLSASVIAGLTVGWLKERWVGRG